MADQMELSEMRLPPEIREAVQAALEPIGVTFPTEMTRDLEIKQTTAFPRSPFIMFINGKSGGGLGPALLQVCTRLLSPQQVFDLNSAAKPHKVVPAVLQCLDQMVAQMENESARIVRKNLKIFVAGGDGTVGWLLSVVENVMNPPPVAVIPLGTGNDLSRSYGWGPTFTFTTEDRIEARLRDGALGKLCELDSWSLRMTPSPDMDTAAMAETLPHALHQSTVPGPEGEMTQFTGDFYNYFSFGMDAQVAYAFHHLRNEHPEVARGPRINKGIYAMFGCTQGWFCATCAPQGQARCLHMIANMQVQYEEGGPFVGLPIDNQLRAMMILNLQSYAGGRDPWGKPGEAVETEKGWSPARPDDGKLEVLGLKDGWQSLFMLGGVGAATRICQAYGVRIELRGEHRSAAYLQVDGEPWEQKLSADSREPTLLEIVRKPRRALMLAHSSAQVLEHKPLRDPQAEANAVAAAAVTEPAAAASEDTPASAEAA